jgi:DNA-binding transcriptional MocR family regulator
MASNFLGRWSASISASSKPAYLAIADVIAEDIQTGKLVANQKLPTLRALAKSLALNFTTVARGYAEAQQRGLIDARARGGTFVREMARRTSPASTVDMTMNMPPEPQDRSLLARMRQGITELAGESDPYSLLRYQEFGGDYRDREIGAQWLAPYLPDIDAARVLVCPGIQDTLLALFTALARPGDSIACEAITYPGIKGIAAQLGIRLKGLPIDDAGIDPDAFAALCAAAPPKALYCNPTLQNPTTVTMTQERRKAIVDIARRHNVPIIEDDAYGGLPARRPQAIAALAPELTFYLAGFSKCFGAGLRIAYLALPNSRYTARLSATLRTTAIMASPFMVRLASRWIEDGTVKMMTQAIREESRARQQLAAKILRGADYAAKPEAFHLWLKVPASWSRIEFATHLRAHGVGVVVSDTFTVGSAAPEAVRVCLGGAIDREGCRRILEIIEDAIKHLPAQISREM